MGRKPMKITRTFNKGKANEKSMKVELFPWEKLDYVSKIKRQFSLR
jgi:S-adenosylmethionine synthetase